MSYCAQLPNLPRVPLRGTDSVWAYVPVVRIRQCILIAPIWRFDSETATPLKSGDERARRQYYERHYSSTQRRAD